MRVVHTCSLAYMQNINTYIFKNTDGGYTLFFYNFPFPSVCVHCTLVILGKRKIGSCFALLTLLPHSDFALLSLQTISVSHEVAAGCMCWHD